MGPDDRELRRLPIPWPGPDGGAAVTVPFHPPRPPAPALEAWRRELAAGVRTATTFDPLWRAACREQRALDYATFPAIAARYRREAAEIIRTAARMQRARA